MVNGRNHKRKPKAKSTKSQPSDNNDDVVVVVEEERRKQGAAKWKESNTLAQKFFAFLHSNDYSKADVVMTQDSNNNYGDDDDDDFDLNAVDRDVVHRLFEVFMKQEQQQKTKKQPQLESMVMARLRVQKLCRTKRYPDGVVQCSFARQDKTFAPLKERHTARDKLIHKREEMQADKGGLVISHEPNRVPFQDVYPVGQKVTLEFPFGLESYDPDNDNQMTGLQLMDVKFGGHGRNAFQVVTKTPSAISFAPKSKSKSLWLSFQSNRNGVFRAHFIMSFQNGLEHFSILRNVLIRVGDADFYDILKPKTPYKKKERKFEKPIARENVFFPPKAPGPGGSNPLTVLKQFKIPVDVQEMIQQRQMEHALAPPGYDETQEEEFPDVFSTFWQNMLWVAESQAYEDIKLFDMEKAHLQKFGRFFKLHVEGLAEGRPSVLRGDLVDCTWKGKKYRGRVINIEMLDVILEFHKSFHSNFNVNLDVVDVVRFTFGRTSFRTSHEGALRAPHTMGMRMLLPQSHHVDEIIAQQSFHRDIPSRIAWSSSTINQEQKTAVARILKGEMRPMPFVIFGPPGTGKTTTVVEAVYQLARIHKNKVGRKNKKKLNILLVAPSNDAADILVEKLSQYFPRSEMMRVLAFSRSIDQCPLAVRPYVREGLSGGDELVEEIKSVQIVVSTVNLAARFWCSGEQKDRSNVLRGHFDVLCVDEAGHATEPEVIGVAATLMDFNNTENPGQLILAGDPMQLGPIITSEICKKLGMSVSYMERLVKTSPAYKGDNDNANSLVYPPELVSLLVRNYRSHPSILKLPNEMFYNNKLQPCGDRFVTHSMAKWEHSPKKNGFPIIFHAMDGENLREGSSPSWFNPQEASEAVQYVELLVKHSRPPINPDDIGIITPYARQVQKIKLALNAKQLGNVKVGSVETFQGQERRCIIISTVRSENDLVAHDLKYNLGFVANEKRFNVAVTRAKALLIVIGNPRVLATDEKNWLPLLRFCRDNDSWVGDEWDEDEHDDENDEIVLARNPSASEEEGWTVVAEQEAFGFINREE